MSASSAVADRGDDRAGGGDPAPAGRGAERRRAPARRPRPTRPGSRCRSARSRPGTSRRACAAASDRRRAPPRAASWWAISDHGPLGVGVAELGDHVPGRLARRQRPARRPQAVRDIVGEQPGRRGARPRSPPAGASAGAGDPGRDSGRGERRRAVGDTRRGTPPRRCSPRRPARSSRAPATRPPRARPRCRQARSSGASASTTSRRVSIEARASTSAISSELVGIERRSLPAPRPFGALSATGPGTWRRPARRAGRRRRRASRWA